MKVIHVGSDVANALRVLPSTMKVSERAIILMISGYLGIRTLLVFSMCTQREW